METSEFATYIVGRQPLASKCHSLFYCKKFGLKSICDLSADEKLLLTRRLGINLMDNDKICFHHEAMYLEKYETMQNKCCNPFGTYRHFVKTGLLKVDLEMADKLNRLAKVNAKPGQKICPRCKSKFIVMLEAAAPSSLSSDEFEMDTSSTINNSLSSLGESPLKLSKVSHRDLAGYTKLKIERVQDAIKHRITAAARLSEEQAGTSSETSECNLCPDYVHLVKEMKKELAVSDRSKKN